MSEVMLLQAFGYQQTKVIDHLSRLLPYLEADQFALSGSVAMVMQLAARGVAVPGRDFNDLDLTIRYPKVVSPAVAKDFMIAHYHPADSYFALVDRQTCTKADLFTWLPASEDQNKLELADLAIPTVSLEALTVIAFGGLAKILRGEIIERKRLNDALLVWPHIDQNKAQHLWQQTNQTDQLIDLVNKVNQLAGQRPALVTDQAIKNRRLSCAECEPNGGYQLTPLAEVYKIMGLAN